MTRCVARLALGLAVALPLAAGSAAAQQFSADLLGADVGGRPEGKLRVADGKVRIEMEDGSSGVFLVDGRAATAYYLRPADRIFMEAKESSPLTQLLVPVDPNDPCRAWQAMAAVAGLSAAEGQWRCERVGPDSVDGRRAIKYRVRPPRGEEGAAWIDPALRFPIKFEGAVSVMVTHIEPGPQPSTLFAIPADFSKFDPNLLIERIKQSDVWVEPPR